MPTLRHLLRFGLTHTGLCELLRADGLLLPHLQRIFGRPIASTTAGAALKEIERGGVGVLTLTNLDHAKIRRSARQSALAAAEEAFLGAECHPVVEGILTSLRSADLAPELSAPLDSRETPPIQPCDLEWLRLTSAAAADSGAYLRATPGPHTTLEDAELRASLWMRYGLPCPEGHESCDPTPNLDPTGNHRLGCRAFAGLRTARHDAMARELFAFARRADPRSVVVEREQRAAGAESRLRPGDVVVDCGGGRVFYDVTVVSPFPAARLRAARKAGTPAFAAEEGYDSKVLKHAAALRASEPGATFSPLAVTALGVWDDRSARALSDLSRSVAAATGSDTGRARGELMERLSIALSRGNYRLLSAGRCSDGATPD